MLVSFLIGFGFNAYVVCGWVDKATSAMDRKLEKCPMLAKAEIQAEADTSHLRYLLHIDHYTSKYFVVHTSKQRAGSLASQYFCCTVR